MQKTYSRINWENYPSEETPINESNLNRMDFAIDEIDDRVLDLDTQKASVAVVANLIKTISVDDETGVITITKQNGAQVRIQTTLNKLAINFGYDYATQELLLYLNDGTVARVNLSTLIQNNEFSNSETINLSVSQLGKVTARIVEHSVGDEHLRTDYLADIRESENHADQYQRASQNFSFDAEAWAKGTRAAEPVQSGQPGFNDNSKYYKGRSEAWATGEVEGIAVPSTDPNYQNNSKYYTGRSEAWSSGEVDGIEVTSGDIAYQNNSKYYMGRSEAWATGQFQRNPVLPGDPAYENNAKYYSEVTASLKNSTNAIKDQAAELLQSATDRLTGLNIMINYTDGCLYYDINSGIRLNINYETGNLEYEIVT